ncbi:MAG TPA: hypothetical protein VLL52_21225 [Anaerolineae bacterium]|nr:hypothetical protein [Anaerolineae bacterium]
MDKNMTLNAEKKYSQATHNTASDLHTIASTDHIRQLSSLSLPEIDKIVNLVAQATPAGNVPGLILNGLARLPGRIPPADTVRRDIALIFKGVEQTLDKVVYSTFFGGPAVVLWAYQQLLRLAGKSPEAAFPEGTWQFYVNYALREDSARHSHETTAFHHHLGQHNISLPPTDHLTAWLLTAIHTLHQFPQLLANEWRERVFTYQLQSLWAQHFPQQSPPNFYRQWEKNRPYARLHDAAPHENYPAYRQRLFDDFMRHQLAGAPPNLLQEWQTWVRAAQERDLPLYQQQMSIQAFLEPAKYDEKRTPIPTNNLHVGLIYQGRYYLLPATQADGSPTSPTTVRQQIATLLQHPATFPPARLTPLATCQRATLTQILPKLTSDLRQQLASLRLAPIWINADPRPRHLPLAQIRQAERAIGDHPLTLFFTEESTIFDQSHIFFDGAWGAALAEIMTNEALAWANYLNTLHPPTPADTRPYAPPLTFTDADRTLLQQIQPVIPEVSVETTAIDINAILKLRQLFKQRNDLLRLTVNDLLVLYRAIHAATYQPSASLLTLLDNDPHAAIARAAIKNTTRNPAILIPVDASQRQPRDRLYPLTFTVPLADLNLLNLHQQALDALGHYRQQQIDNHNTAIYKQFQKHQGEYLSTLGGFGDILSTARNHAIAGKTDSIEVMKMMAHVPAPLHHFLDGVSNRIDILNDMIKGNEVFSNVGAVAPTSSLNRFISAKDDNEKKQLIWGVMTDAHGTMHLSLRDFRPHVTTLLQAKRQDLATAIAQDYIDSYAQGLNQYIRDLHRITFTSSQHAKKTD